MAAISGISPSLAVTLATQTKAELTEIIKLLVGKYGEDASKFVNDHCATTDAVKKASLTTPGDASKKQSKEAAIQALRRVNDKKFDFSIYRQRRIAIQLQYDGGPYYGFASQVGECEDTIEKHLFEALLKVRLIESRQTADYNRCGRTDAGVSAFGQVIGLNVRSAFPLDASMIVREPQEGIAMSDTDVSESDKDKEVVLPAHPCDSLQVMKVCKDRKRGDQIRVITTKELDYCNLLNRILPPTIRAISWKPVTPGFNARFSAGARTYRYFFLNRTYSNGSVQFDIDRMSQAVKYMVGEYDFRNFCKMDITSVSNFRRHIYSAEIKLFSRGSAAHCEGTEVDMTDGHGSSAAASEGQGQDHVLEENVYMLEISGLAFLWHMVRCIMTVLFMVGSGLEEPTIVSDLLDLEKYPGKPVYDFAPEKQLVLHKCHFDRLTFSHHSPRVLWSLNQHYSRMYEQNLLAAARAKNAMQQVQALRVRNCDVDEFLAGLLDGGKDTLYAVSRGKGKGSAREGADSDNKAGGNGDCSNAKRTRLNDSDTEVSSSSSSSAGSAMVTSDSQSSGNAVSSDDDSGKCVPLYELLARLKDDFDVAPDSNCLSSNNARHVPLSKRPCADTYEVRAANVTGVRQDRMERHLDLKGKAHELDPNFFHKMRAEGDGAPI